MQLKRLWIKEYKNLKNFEILFEHNVSILIGENGSGKSTILEAISIIFSTLDDCKDGAKMINAPFDYQMEYISGNEIFFVKLGFNGKKRQYSFLIKENIKDPTGLLLSKEDFFGKTLKHNRLIGYYSGDNTRLKHIFNEKDDKLIGIIKKGKNQGKKFFYFQPYYFDVALLYLYLMKKYNPDIASLLGEKANGGVGLGTFNSMSIKFKRPAWGNNTKLYWGSKGILLEVIKLLEKNSKQRFFNNKQREFELNFSDLDFLLEHTWTGTDFGIFEAFDMLFLNDIIDSIEINYNLGDKNLNTKNLSEGERQYIIVNCLKFYFSGGESENLFLMDEPDTYLHPNWQKNFVPGIIKENNNTNSHFIIATHSPLIVGSSADIDIIGLGKNNVTPICSTNEHQCKKYENCKLIDVYGNRAEFIYEHVFGLESTRGNDFEKEVKILHNLLKKKAESSELTKQEKGKVEKLKKYLISKIGDDIDDLYLSYLSIEDLAKIIKQSNEKNK